MEETLKNELIRETRLEDIADSYKSIAELIGLENIMKLSTYAQGGTVYIPKFESIIRPARNRKIKMEYTGNNEKELAKKYELTPDQIGNILRGVNPNQLSLFDFNSELFI